MFDILNTDTLGCSTSSSNLVKRAAMRFTIQDATSDFGLGDKLGEIEISIKCLAIALVRNDSLNIRHNDIATKFSLVDIRESKRSPDMFS